MHYSGYQGDFPSFCEPVSLLLFDLNPWPTITKFLSYCHHCDAMSDMMCNAGPIRGQGKESNCQLLSNCWAIPALHRQRQEMQVNVARRVFGVNGRSVVTTPHRPLASLLRKMCTM